MKTSILISILFLNGYLIFGQNNFRHPEIDTVKSEIIGHWVFDKKSSKYQKQLFKPTKRLKNKDLGYHFKSDGTVTIRANHVGCVVIGKKRIRKVILDNEEGTWIQNDDGEILIEYESFTGKFHDSGSLQNHILIISHPRKE